MTTVPFVHFECTLARQTVNCPAFVSEMHQELQFVEPRDISDAVLAFVSDTEADIVTSAA